MCVSQAPTIASASPSAPSLISMLTHLVCCDRFCPFLFPLSLGFFWGWGGGAGLDSHKQCVNDKSDEASYSANLLALCSAKF